MSQMIKTVIVEDDPLTRKVIEGFVNRTEPLIMTGSYGDAVQAAQMLNEAPCDLLLLDIEMPDMSGFELLETLGHSPAVIIITSKPKYAVEAFDVEAIDFIVKPIRYPRFLKAVQKARRLVEQQDREAPGVKVPRLFVRVEGEYVGIRYSDIYLLESRDDYVTIYTANKRFTIYSTLKGMFQKLPQSEFMRVHRSYVVRLEEIETFEDNTIKVGDKLIPIGGTFRAALLKALRLD
ncbi:MAG: LytTR family DNA-binding domain-containing protein [Bacteroidota bacterium]